MADEIKTVATDVKTDATVAVTAVKNADNKAIAWVKAHAAQVVIGLVVIAALVVWRLI